ncbi:SpoIID/LytB domain-containing protein [Peribacillus sp. NPDC060186]
MVQSLFTGGKYQRVFIPDLPNYFFRQSTGKLIVSVFEKNTEKPINNAKVLISENKGNGKIVATLQTNISGKTDTIVLPAPPREYASQPNGPKPYSEYTVTVEAPGYTTVKIRGVAIFAETTAKQKVELTPIRNEGTGYPIEIIDIPEHKLTGQYLELLPQWYSPGLYSNVRIPGLIIVHDGHPFVYAPRYIVRFKEYIKNVAASELYPTWPNEAIKANVLSIISFILNRIHTKHYHSKGFDISSSTLFDQIYVHGKTTFKEIDKIVDELFNQYIVKPGAFEPLLAHRCSGIKDCRSGYLSQWGSKYLADHGKNYMEILFHYYHEVQLRFAPLL